MIAAFTNVGKERVFSLVGRISAGGVFMGAGGTSDCWMGIDVFCNCGSCVYRKRARMYERTDFNSYCMILFFVISLMNVCVLIY